MCVRACWCVFVVLLSLGLKPWWLLALCHKFGSNNWKDKPSKPWCRITRVYISISTNIAHLKCPWNDCWTKIAVDNTPFFKWLVSENPDHSSITALLSYLANYSTCLTDGLIVLNKLRFIDYFKVQAYSHVLCLLNWIKM